MTPQDGSPDRPGMPVPDARRKARAPRRELEAFTTDELKLLYLRQMRNVQVTMGVLAVVGFIAALIIGIVVIVDIAHLSNLLEHFYGGPSINCQSRGGTNPSC
jgi:hypothetical protein